MTRAHLALGSNVGDREAHLERARSLIGARARVTARSSVRETPPYGVLDQPPFLNQVLEVRWAGPARALLKAAQEIEREVGRRPRRRWGPREIDVDLVLFGSEVIDEPDLKVPHPGLGVRRFVLEPLLEIDPDLSDPATGRRLDSLLAAILDG